jgi:hypothetical protein
VDLVPIKDVRPAAVGRLEAKHLGAYLAFRHLVRNLYPHNLQPQRMEELVAELPLLWPVVRPQMENFFQWNREQL